MQAALDYMGSHLISEVAATNDGLMMHFERMRAEAREHYQQRRLATLNKWFRDLAAPALVDDGHAFAVYIQKTTGLAIDVKSDFEKRVERVCKRKRIRTDAEFYDMRDMIDSLNPLASEHESQLQLFYDLVAELYKC